MRAVFASGSHRERKAQDNGFCPEQQRIPALRERKWSDGVYLRIYGWVPILESASAEGKGYFSKIEDAFDKGYFFESIFEDVFA